MPSALEAVAKQPAAPQTRLVVYITPEDAAWLAQVQAEAKAAGRQLSASAIVRAALGELRAGQAS
jgi:hypothetical protein